MNILIGLLKGYKGKVKVNQTEMNQAKAGFYEHIGVAFEFPNLYMKLSGLENLDFFKNLYRLNGRKNLHNPEELLKMVGLLDDKNKPVESYSKGMRMRLNLCRAMIHNPEILFLDEPTSGLDPVSSQNIRNIIHDLKEQGTTILLTTHNMHVADELCDQIAFVVDGKIPVIDSPRDLKLAHGKDIVKVEYTVNAGSAKTASYPLHNIGKNKEFLALLEKAKLETIHSQEATLDDIFIKVTGRSLV